jgi:hypothetical protein
VIHTVGLGHRVDVDDDDGNRFDSPWWVIELVVRLKLSLDPEVYTTKAAFAWDRGGSLARAGPMAHNTSSTVRALTDFLGEGHPSILVSFTEDWGGGNWIGPCLEVWVKILHHT